MDLKYDADDIDDLKEDLREWCSALSEWEGMMGRRSEDMPHMEDAFNVARNALEALQQAVVDELVP